MTQKLFRRKEDIFPVSAILTLSLIDLFVFFTIENKLFVFIYFILMIIPKGIVCAWNHHHQHTSVFKSKPHNRILEFFYALHTGAITNLWVLHHNLGHHRNYLNQDKDESRWKTKDGKTMGYWRYSLEVAFTSYNRAWKVGDKYKKLRKEMVYAVIVISLFIFALAIYNPFNALMLFIFPMIISLFLTAQATYKHHVGLDTQNKYEASHTDLNKFWNVLTGNLGLHTAHHIKPNVHWSDLPKVHEEIKHLIPEKNMHFNTF